MNSNRNAELAKNTLILTIGQLVPKLISIFTLPVLTKNMLKSEYGLLELNITVASICIPLLGIQIQQAVFRYLIEKKIAKDKIISTSFLFLLLMILIGACPIVGFWYLYCDNLSLAVLFTINYTVELMLGWEGQVSRGLNDNISYSLSYVIYSISYIVLLIFKSSITYTISIQNVITCMIFSYINACIYLIVKKKLYMFIKIGKFDTITLSTMLSYSAPMVISSVSLWIVNLSDRLLISAYLGLEATAVYAVTNKVPNLFNSIYGIFNLAWTENASKLTIEEKKQGYYSEFFKDFYTLMTGVIICLVAMSPILFDMLIDIQYISGYYLIPWLFVGVFFSSLVSFYGSIYVGEKKTGTVGISSAVGAIINILINFIFMKKYGILVAALSTIISYFIICVYRAVDIKKYVLIKYDKKRIIVGLCTFILTVCINSKKSLLSLYISIAIAIVYNLVFNKKVIEKIIKIMLRKIMK